MTKINFAFLQRTIDLNERTNAEQAQYIEMCKQRLSAVPGEWELLTANWKCQSFRDNHGDVRFFSIETGLEINGDE